jgi:hypothetical protein
MTADRREQLVKLLAANDHLRPAELADLILDTMDAGRDPELAHRLTRAIDDERRVSANPGTISPAVVNTRRVTDALIEQVAR